MSGETLTWEEHAEVVATALAELRDAAEAWPLPNRYRDAFLAGDSALEALVVILKAAVDSTEER